MVQAVQYALSKFKTQGEAARFLGICDRTIRIIISKNPELHMFSAKKSLPMRVEKTAKEELTDKERELYDSKVCQMKSLIGWNNCNEAEKASMMSRILKTIIRLRDKPIKKFHTSEKICCETCFFHEEYFAICSACYNFSKWKSAKDEKGKI